MSQKETAALLAELAYHLLRQGDTDRATQLLEGLEELRPDHPTPFLLQGLVHFARRDFGRAERSYRTSLEKDSGSQLAKAFLAESLIPQKRYREAEALLAEVVKAGGDDDAVGLAKSLQTGLEQGLFQRA